MSAAGSIPPPGGKPPQPPGTAAPLDDRAKARLQKAAREFESMFMSYMLKSMRSSMSKEEMFGDSFGGDVMEGMFDVELARQMSRTSNLGIGEMLYRKMTGEPLPRSAPHTPSASAPAVPAAAAAPAAPPVVPAAAEKPDLPPPAPAKKPDLPPPAAAVPPARPAPEPAPAPRTSQARIDQRLDPYRPIIQAAAEQHSVSSNLLKAVIASESAGNPRAHSPANAKGLMQLVDTTAAAMGVRDVWDPRQNIFGGAKYLQQLLERFGGNLEQAVASYNAGPGAVEKHGGIPPFAETRAYVSRVMKYLHYFEGQEDGTNDDN